MSRGVLRLLVRSEVRRSWRSLLGLALIVAVVGTVVLAAAAGARRTASVLDRAQETTKARDLRVQVDDEDGADRVAAAIAASPEVAVSAEVGIYPVDAGGEYDLALFGDPEGAMGHTIDRPVAVRGRLPAAGAADEVALNEAGARVLGLDVGDPLPVGTFTAEDVDLLVSEGAFNGFNGPRLDLRVVGVMRTLDDLQGGATFAGPLGLVGPGFFDEHVDVAGFPPVLALRLADPDLGTADIDARVAELAGGADVTTELAEDAYGGSVRRAIGALSLGLLVFTVVAGLAGLLTVGQAVSRQVQAAGLDDEGLRQLGMDRASRVLARALPVTAAIVLGVGLGTVGSVLASTRFPIGLARRAEADPGIQVDLLVGAVGAAVLAAAAGAVAFWRSRPRPPLTAAEQSVPFSAAIIRPILPRVVPLVGARMALEPGRGRRSVPVRSAVVGVALGTVGVIAVGVISASLDRLVDDPAHWGWTWSTAPDVEDPEALGDAMADDDRLAGAAWLVKATVVLDGADTPGFALDTVRGDVALALREGRAPAAPDEVALGHRTADALDVEIGDHVPARVAEGEGTVPLEVVGEAVFPIIDNPAPGEGALLTPPGLDEVRRSDGFASLLLDYPEGADVGDLEADLATDYGLSYSAYSRPNVPGDVANVGGLRTLTIVLGGFFVALAVVALGHVLMLSSRRRRMDFAVLRAFGFRRRQVRRSVGVQALVTVVVGMVIGVPLGWVAGRVVWRLMVGDLGLVDEPSSPWALLAAFLPAVVVVALVVAVVPAWSAARRRPADALRAE
jgi:hypothetical protein